MVRRGIATRLAPLFALLVLSACTVAPGPTPSPTDTASPTGPTSSPSASASPSPEPTSACPSDWDTDAKTDAATSTGPIFDVRAGRHECYDRLVVDIRGPLPGYDIRYVDEVVQDGSGEPVALRGSAFIKITIFAPSYDATTGAEVYEPTNRNELVNVTGFHAFRQIAFAGSFEGQTTIGLGVESELSFTVFTLDGPGEGSRVVIDVAHPD